MGREGLKESEFYTEIKTNIELPCMTIVLSLVPSLGPGNEAMLCCSLLVVNKYNT